MKIAEQLILINEYCDEFESALKSKQLPSIDKTLKDASDHLPSSAQSQLAIELIALEIAYRPPKS